MDENGTGVPEQGVSPSRSAVTPASVTAPLDELDRRIVVALQHDGRASWRSIAQLVQVPVSTVARRGQRLLDEGIARVLAVPAVGSEGPFEMFWVRIQCSPGEVRSVARTLADDPNSRFVAIVTGEYDLICELVVRGGKHEQFTVIEDLRQISGVRSVRSDLIAHVYKMSYDWGRQMHAELFDDEPPRAPSETVECGPHHFDDSDWKILEVLRNDGRESFQRVADVVGLNESSVRRRFDRMKQTNCVDLVTLVPSAALGMESEVLLQVRIVPSQITAVAQQLASHTSVRFMALLLDENSLLCEVITPSMDALYEFLNVHIAQMDGVLGWTAAKELLYLKRGFVKSSWGELSLGQPVAG